MYIYLVLVGREGLVLLWSRFFLNVFCVFILEDGRGISEKEWG